MRPFRPLLFVALAVAAGLLGGCISRPTPSYRRVDTETPEFKAAVARETAAEQAKGVSASAAAETAVQRVTTQAIAAEKERRTDLVAPLTAAMAALEAPRGCWAYTVATTTEKNGKTTADVERFDPSQPEERIWTLVTRNGLAPTAAEQSDYREGRLKKWKRQQAASAKRKSAPEWVKQQALSANLKVDRPAGGGPVAVSFDREPVSNFMAAIPGSHETYLIDEAEGRVVHHDRTYPPGKAGLGKVITIEAFESATDYVVVDPTVAPFPARIKLHYHLHIFGKDLGDIRSDAVYSDYRRVKCYEDRFEVQIGAPTVQDFVPEK